jgi:pimeloyl-ACP methyl ester carboxylesterase
MRPHVFYRTVKVDGLSIFYREAGQKDAPVILLLHGLPSSSRMYEPLLSRLTSPKQSRCLAIRSTCKIMVARSAFVWP